MLARRASLVRNWRGSGSSGAGTGRQQSQARIMVHFVVAGQVAEFREVEQHSTALGLGAIDVMPVHIPDLFL